MKAGQWSPIAENFCMTDEACITGSLPRELPNGQMTTNLTDGAWSEGVLEWDIPWSWGALSCITGDVPIKRLPMKYNQLFQMAEDGCLTISKFGEAVSRTTNLVIRLNGVIVEGKLLPCPNGGVYE